MSNLITEMFLSKNSCRHSPIPTEKSPHSRAGIGRGSAVVAVAQDLT